MKNFVRRFRQKTAGFSNQQIAQEVALVLKNRFIHRYRRWRQRFFPITELSDQQLQQQLNIDLATVHPHFCQQPRPAIFPGLVDLTSTAQLQQHLDPTMARQLITQADTICRHQFHFLGFTHRYPAQELNWHYDSTIDYEWPRCHYSEIPWGVRPNADVKIPWELARFQHAITLVQAYHLTQKECYPQEFCQQLRSFVQQNPYEMGIHWACAMEVGLRAVSLCLAFYGLRHSPSIDTAMVKLWLKTLYQHGHFIINNLEFSHRITSNHYLSDLVGLLFIGLLVPELRPAKNWAAFAEQQLLIELNKQVYPDGVNWEASTAYHAFVVELYLYSLLLIQAQGRELPKPAKERLAAMCRFIQSYLKPNHQAPLIGDCDDGRLITWQPRAATDPGYLLALAAVVFNDAQFKQSGEFPTEALWTLGQSGWEKFQTLPLTAAPGSSAFPLGGVYVQRHGELYAIIDCGDVGIRGQGSHSHNDLLALEVHYGPTTFLVDPGSYVYTRDPEARNLFRATAYHNTVMVDETEINPIQPEYLFAIGRQAQPQVNCWQSTAKFDLLDAQHDGYRRLANGIIHRRQILLDKEQCHWLITDQLQGQGQHLFQFFFNLAPNLVVQQLANQQLLITDPQAARHLFLAPLDTNDLSLTLVARYVSTGYGCREKSIAAVYTVRAVAPQQRRFLLLPTQYFVARVAQARLQQLQQSQ
jgi:Heparinase II/III-like protein/Heparinase II/III N-terminus